MLHSDSTTILGGVDDAYVACYSKRVSVRSCARRSPPALPQSSIHGGRSTGQYARAPAGLEYVAAAARLCGNAQWSIDRYRASCGGAHFVRCTVFCLLRACVRPRDSRHIDHRATKGQPVSTHGSAQSARVSCDTSALWRKDALVLCIGQRAASRTNVSRFAPCLSRGTWAALVCRIIAE